MPRSGPLLPQSNKNPRGGRARADATGLAQGALSTFFVRRQQTHTQQPLPWRHWFT